MSDKRENSITRILLIIAIVLSVIALIRSTRTTSTNNARPIEVRYIESPHSETLSTEALADKYINELESRPNNTNEIHVPDEWRGSFGRHYSSEGYLRSIGGVTRDDVDDMINRKSRRSMFDSPSSPTRPASSYFKDPFPTSSYFSDTAPTSHSFSESVPASSYFND